MKSKLIKGSTIVCIAAFLVSATAAAQRESSRKPRSTTSNRQVQPGNQPTSVPGIYDGIPIIIDSSALDETPPGTPMKPTTPFGLKDQDNRNVLEYEHLRRDDALYAQKVWRELDLREKMNHVFTYNAIEDNGSQLFINILLSAVKSGKVAAFADDRFSIPVTPVQVTEITRGKMDTTFKYSVKKIDVIEAIVVSRKSFDLKTVAKLRIMEEWVFDKESSRMFCRIIGIAALKTEYYPNTNKERGSSVMFWLHYPDLRPILANYQVYNPKNMGQGRMTWEELFESRMFSSYIVKSTLNNPANLSIKQYIKDPTLALLEGDNIKEKIFNYEQDLWSY